MISDKTIERFYYRKYYGWGLHKIGWHKINESEKQILFSTFHFHHFVLWCRLRLVYKEMYKVLPVFMKRFCKGIE